MYLANALVPESDDVAVAGQERDGDQRELTINFVIRGTPAASRRAWLWMSLVGALALIAAELNHVCSALRPAAKRAE